MKQVLSKLQVKEKERRGYQLKYNLIPYQTKRIEKKQLQLKEEVNKLKRYKRDLLNIEFGLDKEIHRGSFLESLRCEVGKPKGKLPKSWGVVNE